MKVRKNAVFILLILLCCISAAARQINSFNVLEFPLALTKTGADTLYVSWVGGVESPDSAAIYFARTSGGGVFSHYRQTVTALANQGNRIREANPSLGLPRRRGTAFTPAGQGGNMGPGTYYCIVAAVKGTDTLYSSEFTIMVDAPRAPRPRGPSGRNLTNLTPTFSWDRVPNADVPYYHVILSDEPLPINFDDIDNPQIEGDMSIIWQAITPKTSITYGEPDPSGTITASPPPLSPGKEYSWLVFNNFGNHPAFSSDKLSLPEPFLQFTIAGTPLNKPQNTLPANSAVLNPEANPEITFSWTNLDVNASTYLVNLFVDADPEDLGFVNPTGQDNFRSSLLVWETTVSRGDKGQNETLTARLDAKNTLTGGRYKWRVFALDSKGAGTAGDSSIFRYNVPAGRLEINTKEIIGEGVEANVGVVELRSDVLSGPMEKPLAFYTSTSGSVTRERPVGTYRLTAVKDGYKTETRTVTVRHNVTEVINIYMERPRATIFGRVTDTTDMPLNLASVTAVSEWGDTVRAFTNGTGNYTLSCSDADWTVSVEMAGYRSSSPRKIPLSLSEKHQFDVRLERNPIVFSGSVVNPNGTPIIGARVRIFREGALVNELPSTPQSGNFSFSLSAGVYTLTVDKAGFTTHSGEIAVSGSRTQNVTLRPGAALINGVVIGRSWSNEMNAYIHAPVPSASVRFWQEGSGDTVKVVSDAVFGNFSVGLEGGKSFNYASNAIGFMVKGTRVITAQSNQTQNISDTLNGLAMITGSVKNEAGQNMSGVDVVVFDIANSRVASTGRSFNDGRFEVRNIYDGEFSVNAARSGFYLDGGAREFKVTDGKPQAAEGFDLSAPFVLKAGETEITWSISGYSGKGFIKIASPYMGSYAFNESLKGAGPGDYIIEAEAEDKTLLNLSYHKFSVNEGVTTHPVSFSLPFKHTAKAALKVRDVIQIDGGSALSDSARFFYRSEGSTEFRSERFEKNGNSYSLPLPAGVRDGSNLYYYFRVYTKLNGGDIYGSQKQIYTSHVEPEPTVISRFEIIPGASGGDAILLPSSYGAQFSLKAFYSSSFIALGEKEMSSLASSITWSLEGKDRADCRFEGSSRGLNVTVQTGSKKSDEVILVAALNLPQGSAFSLAQGLTNSYRVPFKVSGSALKSMEILRTDPKAPDAISNNEEAAFRAVGIDDKGEKVTVSPLWTILPGEAGSIGSDGRFVPHRRYVGNVRVFAAAGKINSEFNPIDKENKITDPGLVVSYVLRNSPAADTISNFKGLRIAFPAGSINPGEVEQFEVYLPDMRNQMKKSSGNLRVADSVAFDIVPRGGNAKLNFGRSGSSDSINVILNVPVELQESARKNGNFYVAWWNSKKLQWQTEYEDGKKINSKVSLDGSSVSAAVSHFSEYALVMRPEKFNAALSISPNPFSPFIRPVREYRKDFNREEDVPLGSCIKVRIDAPGQRVSSVKVHVYNAVGHRVWAVERLNPEIGEHRFWWNGRTTKREEVWHENESAESFYERTKRNPMARNGRYFVTVIVKNTDGELKRIMKPVVLMK